MEALLAIVFYSSDDRGRRKRKDWLMSNKGGDDRQENLLVFSEENLDLQHTVYEGITGDRNNQERQREEGPLPL